MATVINQTRVGAPAKATGGVSSAIIGTALPTDAKNPLDQAFKLSGLISEDGLTESPKRDNEDVKSWGGHLARVLQSDYAIEVTLTYIERTEETLKQVHGDANVTVQTSGAERTVAITKNANQLEPKSYVADMLDGKTKLRLVYPRAQVSSVGESSYNHRGLITYPVTLKCYPDENGNYGYEYESTSLA